MRRRAPGDHHHVLGQPEENLPVAYICHLIEIIPDVFIRCVYEFLQTGLFFNIYGTDELVRAGQTQIKTAPPLGKRDNLREKNLIE